MQEQQGSTPPAMCGWTHALSSLALGHLPTVAGAPCVVAGAPCVVAGVRPCRRCGVWAVPAMQGPEGHAQLALPPNIAYIRYSVPNIRYIRSAQLGLPAPTMKETNTCRVCLAAAGKGGAGLRASDHIVCPLLSTWLKGPSASVYLAFCLLGPFSLLRSIPVVSVLSNMGLLYSHLAVQAPHAHARGAGTHTLAVRAHLGGAGTPCARGRRGGTWAWGHGEDGGVGVAAVVHPHLKSIESSGR
jgi:hypothetical protein